MTFIPKEYSRQQVKKLQTDAKYYIWEEPYLFRRCSDGIIQRCVPDEKTQQILWYCHGLDYGGHFGGERTATKVLQSGFYWPNLLQDSRAFVKNCDRYEKAKNLPANHEIPQQGILEVELFDVWVELEHKSYWEIKYLNLDAQAVGTKRMIQLNELDKFRYSAHENAKFYKERTKI
ncbi:uncharacterized protein LOC107606833 [Arachis ipaensis]|uniref:uncharacterized protein LOC107606833 n=1 Tax=Arachis ipaensis TaxID=130454 RepID=UPI0007AF738C|nr:uncharacterized protein LOC107606833 [Arachis ipaensis]XP_025664538.1 uncharacterized protein LOC112762957 [Arachis hypogaea]